MYNVLQDKKGYIWLATDDGLCRYDGFEFKVYKSPKQVSLSGSNITEDKYGRIWYQNFDGYLYYVQGDTLLSFMSGSSPGQFPYCITDKYLFFLKTGTLEIYRLSDLGFAKSYPLDNYYHGVASKTEAFFFADTVLNVIDDQLVLKKVRTPYTDKSYTKQVWVAGSKAYISTKQNELKALYVYEGNTVRKVLDIPQPELIQGFTIIDEIYWVLTAKGAFAYDSSGRPMNNGKAYFEGSSLSTIIKDRQQNYWFSTTNEGIMLVPDLNSETIKLGNNKPNRIVAGANEWFIGTKNDEVLTADKTLNSYRTLYNGGTNADISFLYADNDNLVSVSKKVSVRDKKTGQVKEYKWALKHLYPVDEKYYAYATSNVIGLLYRNERARKVPSAWDSIKTRIDNSFLDGITFKEGLRAKSVVADTSVPIIYYATNKGMYAATPEKGVYEVKMQGSSFFAQWLQIYGNNVYALTTKGDLYILSATNFKLLNDELGLGSGSIKAIKLSGNKLFIKSEKTLSYLRMDEQPLHLHETDIDVTSYDINDLALEGDILLLATDLGIVKVELAEKRRQNVPTAFGINSLTVNGTKRNWTNPLRLSHSENRIAVNYSILNFNPSKEVPLYYSVGDGSWLALSGKTRTLEFQALAPGDYNIQFSFSPDGSHPLTEAARFSIEKPFWQKAWFIICALLVLVIAGFLYYRWRLNIIIRKNRLVVEKLALEEDLSRSMLTSIKAQMNPHFFYNALNTIQGYIFTNDRRNASNYLAKFSKLTRMILEMSGKETISLNEELRALALYMELEKMRFDNDFEFVIETNAGVDTELIKIPSMIIQPYVENAVKHGLLHKEGRKLLSIDIYREQDQLIVKIEDNGIGREKSAEINKTRLEEHTPFSTEANKKRIELLNKGKTKPVSILIADKKDTSGNATGTIVTLTMPIY